MNNFLWHITELLVSATGKMVTQQARCSQFLLYNLFYTHTLALSHDWLLPHWFSRLLACFLLSVTRSLSSGFHDSLDRLLVSCLLPSFLTSPIHWLARLLAFSIIPSLYSSLDFNRPLTHLLPHSLSLSHTFLLLHFLTHYLARLLSLVSRFSRTCSLSDSLSH